MSSLQSEQELNKDVVIVAVERQGGTVYWLQYHLPAWLRAPSSAGVAVTSGSRPPRY